MADNTQEIVKHLDRCGAQQLVGKGTVWGIGAGKPNKDKNIGVIVYCEDKKQIDIDYMNSLQQLAGLYPLYVIQADSPYMLGR